MKNEKLTRRKLTTGTSTAIILALAGCSSGGSDIQDTDGDGVIDSEDYAPRDPEVQSESDVQSSGDSESSGSDSDLSDKSADSSNKASSENINYPSHAGNHTITAKDNYWAWEFSVEANFTLEYRAINILDEEHDFDVLLYPPSKFKTYRAIANDVEEGTRPEYIDGSKPGIESGVEVTNIQLQPGRYYLVVDNTDLSDAGDFGAEEDRQVRIEASTMPQ
jgi:hypothetical protein